MTIRVCVRVTGCVIALGFGACTGPGASPYQQRSGVERNPQLARELYAEAIQIGAEDPAETERLIRAALAADLYLGPAHNNLGVILLERDELYEAASEFEWARKLMPGHPAPRVNLAMTLERAGKNTEAIAAYDAALAVYNGYLPAMKGKARLQIATRSQDAETIELLEDIAMRSDAAWKEWATLWRTKLESR